MATPINLQPGAIFARDFRVVRPLRAGGMGAVYVVDQVSTGKQRALKLMMPELVGNPEVRERFVREARAAANIESEHVVETVIAGIDEESGAPYIVMELLRGEELADALARCGRLELADIGEIFQQIGHALEQAHAAGLVHRDLKPENIYLCVSKRPDAAFTAKVLDFGIAKLVEENVQKTGTQPLGSPLFMSPEQTDRKGRICPATDVWALGLIAFNLLTGKSFWREAEEGSLQTLLREIIVDPLASPSERAAELGCPEALPPGFDAWFTRCVIRDIDERFQEAGEAMRAFVELLVGQSGERQLKISTGAFDAANEAAASKNLELAATAALAAGAAAPPPAGWQSGPQAGAVLAAASGGHAAARTGAPSGNTTGISSMALGESQPMELSAQPAPKRGMLIAVVGGAAALLAAGGFFLFNSGKTGAEDASATSASAAARVGAPSASASAATPPAGPCSEGMVLIEGGSTIVGAKDMPDWTGARQTHPAKVSSFCVDRTEVTVRAYEGCVKDGACEKTPDDVDYKGVSPEAKAAYKDFCNARKPDRLEHPINCVDWNMAQAYCSFRGARLPTEAEWEYAARGSEQRDYPWGTAAPDATRLNAGGPEFAAWNEGMKMPASKMYEADDKFVGTAPVGSFPAGKTPEGVMDMAGNVLEWTADWSAPYDGRALEDPTGPETGTERIARGGAFNSVDPSWVRSAFRWGNLPRTYNHGIGFRCVAALKP